MEVKMVLFKANESVVGKTIKFFTNTDYDHAAMMFPSVAGDVLFEASGWKGQVLAYRKFSDIKDRKVQVLKFQLDNDMAFNQALYKIGTPYDYKGFVLWWLNRQTANKVYCFEYIASILRLDSQLESYVKTIRDGSISGFDLYKIATNIKRAEVQNYDL